MKYAKQLLAIVVTMMPLLASAQIGSNGLVAKVPFQFRAGNTLGSRWPVRRATSRHRSKNPRHSQFGCKGGIVRDDPAGQHHKKIER